MAYLRDFCDVFITITCSLREPGGPCAKTTEVSESRMERVNSHVLKLKFLRGLTCKTPENKTTEQITTYRIHYNIMALYHPSV